MEHMQKERAVMGILGEFTRKRPSLTVILTKIGCVDGHPPKIPVGLVIQGTLTSKAEVGFSFNIEPATVSDGTKWEMWCTSIIQKILTLDTFQTKNSIYKWEIIK